MISLSEIHYTIKLGLYSAFVEGEKPVSIMLLAPVEHGKSELLKQFKLYTSVKVSTDFNTFIFQGFAPDIQRGIIKTIIFPDFLRLIKRKYSTQSSILTILNSLVEEGWTGKLPMGGSVDKPLNCNVITALTEDEIRDKRHKWAKLGFLSRFLPISYSYQFKTKERIRNYIQDRKYMVEDKPKEHRMPTESSEVTLTKDVGEKIKGLSRKIVEEIKEKNLYGFRLQRQLQTLALSNALLSNRKITNDDDFDIINNLTKHINFNFNPL